MPGQCCSVACDGNGLCLPGQIVAEWDKGVTRGGTAGPPVMQTCHPADGAAPGGMSACLGLVTYS